MTPRRRGFTLLEVMIALGILVVSLVILMGTQTTAIEMTEEADRILVATQLAQEKLAEVRLLVEREGFPSDDLYEDGDFSDLGDDVLNLEFEDLEDYKFEFLVTEVDLEAAADLTSVGNNLLSNLGMQGPPGTEAPQLPDLSALGVGPEMITDALDPYLREVRVRVWWGEDSEEAEELGNEVVITTHVASPNAQVFQQNASGNQNNANNPNVPNNPNGPRGNNPRNPNSTGNPRGGGPSPRLGIGQGGGPGRVR